MTWALQDAKNKFSAVADTASKGVPQVVTRHGHPLVVIISYELYKER
ncbi:MAG: type II toxin-antitoxin system Phd/YefM family antitoxin, partial [Kiritimatiellae bacterium]|nr:type II toxin-antitoxin system Phd/YefM family antitoxin [Kiritimatiellia bacterium]